MVDLIDKAPPQNIEAERSVLGSMMIEKEAILTVIGVINKDNFYDEFHKGIFQTIIDLYEKNKAVDIITVTDELKKRKKLEKIGGTVYLTGLIDAVATAANVEYYAKIVREKAILRNLIKVSSQILADGYSDSEDVDKILDRAEQSIFAICQDRIDTGFVPVSDMIQDSIEAIENLYNKKGQVPGVPSGFVELDNLTAGFHPSNLVVIAGRPSMGKTTLCLNIAEHVAINTKQHVAIFSLEMAREELLLRMLCSEARVDAHKVKTGFLGKKYWTALTNAAGILSSAPIFIDDSPSLSVLEMKSRARRLQSEHGLNLVIVDYLQLMPGRTGRIEYRQQEISAITRSLKNMAKDLKIPVIAVSQLSRETEKRQSKRPQLSDLRESGAIEQDADVVLFIYREDYYDQNTADTGEAEIIIGKQRNGPSGVSVKLAFLKDYTRFESLAKKVNV